LHLVTHAFTVPRRRPTVLPLTAGIPRSGAPSTAGPDPDRLSTDLPGTGRSAGRRRRTRGMKPEQSPPGPQLLRIDPFNPQELLGLIPYLIGFRPAESFVLLMFSGSQLVLTARIDLPAPDSATALADYHRELAETYGVTGVLGVVFSDRFVPATELLDRWHAAWSRSEPPESGGGCVILGAWYADGRRCWSRAPGSPAARSGGIPYDPLSSRSEERRV